MDSKLVGALVLFGMAWAVGCQPKPVPLAEARVTADEDFNAVWEASMEVLRQYRFTPDRTDPREGLIVTFPLLGKQWFEFWRADASEPDDVIESSLHTIYRTATVSIRPHEPAAASAPALGKYSATVEVRVSRSVRPAAQVNSTSEAFEMFLHPAEFARSPTGGDPQETASAALVDLNRDRKLEGILQQRINSLAAKKLTLYPR